MADRLWGLAFDYLVCELGAMPAERWWESANVVARVNLPNMRVAPGRRVETYAAAMRGLLELEPDFDRRAKYMDFVDIYARLTDSERRRYGAEYQEDSMAMVGMFQRARDEARRKGWEEGREAGWEEGREEGREEGERTVLERQLRRRFGPSPRRVADRLSRASAAELEAWSDNVLDAATLDDVFVSR